MCDNWSFFEKKLSDLAAKNKERFKEKLKKIHGSRLHPDLISNIKITCYGENSELKSLANIQLTDARTFLIKCYDTSIIEDVAKGIRKQRPEINPNVNGENIIISFPPPTEESRKKTLKEVKQFLEESKIALRMIRKDIQSEIKSAELSEDQEKKFINNLDKKIKEENESLEREEQMKEKEIMTI